MQYIPFVIAATLTFAGQFTTSIGDNYPYMVSTTTTDAAGNTYIVGSRVLGSGGPFAFRIGAATSSSLPVASDVFVTKLDPNGKLLFTNTYAGKGVDTGTAITLDPSGNIYVAGNTTSNDFPLSKALQNQPNSTFGTGFIIKLSNDGTTILYSTYFGGTLGPTSISALATDSKGNLYLTGSTSAEDFPHTTGMPFGNLAPFGSLPTSGAILASISAAGDKILYSGAIVGTAISNPYAYEYGQTTGAGIGVDAAGNAYVAGNTNTTDLATTSGVIQPKGIGAFVAKANAAGTGLSYLTYLGAGQNQSPMSPSITAGNIVNAIAVDAAGNAYLGGFSSGSFPTTPGALQPHFNFPINYMGPGLPPLVFEGFLGKLKPDGSAMEWATYLDRGTIAASGTFVQSIAIDAAGNTWGTGITGYSPFPNTSGVSTGPDFLVGLNAAGSALNYFLNEPIGTIGQSVGVDGSGFVHLAGVNGFVYAIPPASPFIKNITYFQNAFGGNVTARIAPGEVISIYGAGIGPSVAAIATPTSGLYPQTLAGVQVTINGRNMPLLYVSSNQINAIVPMALATGVGATVRVINGTALSPDFPVWIVPSAPHSYPTVLNQDGTINGTSNPARGGSVVTFYGTGWQPNFYPLADGQVATAPKDVCLGNCQIVPSFNVYAPSATVEYGGTAPGIVAGVSQFNVRIGQFAPNQTALSFNFTLTGPSGTLSQIVFVAP
jgi:uncharacterized protein (TIGR03437 family)